MQSSPLLHYQELVRAGKVIPDHDQLDALRALDSLWHQLQARGRPSLWRWLVRREAGGTLGLYLWGGVGRGKTWLMDVF
jgi:cell division protein ZapE